MRENFDLDVTVETVSVVKQSKRETIIVVCGVFCIILGLATIMLNMFGAGFGAKNGDQASADDDADYSSDSATFDDDDNDTVGEDAGPFRTTNLRLGLGLTICFVGAIVIFMAQNYMASIRITAKFVGIEAFNGTWDVYDKTRIKTFRPATQAELGEGICGNDDKMCDGKTVITDAAAEGGCFSWPSAETQTHVIMETNDGEHWCCSLEGPCPWRTFTPSDSVGKSQEVCDRLNAALILKAPATYVSNELVSGAVTSAAL
jgi:hypothetical protein